MLTKPGIWSSSHQTGLCPVNDVIGHREYIKSGRTRLPVIGMEEDQVMLGSKSGSISHYRLPTLYLQPVNEYILTLC